MELKIISLPILGAALMGLLITYIAYQFHKEWASSYFLYSFFPITIITVLWMMCIKIHSMVAIAFLCILFWCLMKIHRHETIFLYWIFAAGISISLDQYAYCFLISLLSGGWLWYWSHRKQTRYLFQMICFDEHCEQMAMKEINHSCTWMMEKKVISEQGIQVALVVTTKEVSFMDKIAVMKGIEKVTLKNYESMCQDVSFIE